MLVLEVVVVIVVLFVVGVVAAGGGGGLRPFPPDRPVLDLPEGRAMSGDDVRDSRFTLAFRGYRMEEVDALAERLANEIELRDTELARLGVAVPAHGDLAASPVTPASPTVAVVAAPSAPSAPAAPSAPSETPGTPGTGADPEDS